MVEYDEAPLRPFHLRIALASCGGVFSDGFGLGIIGISLSHAAALLRLSPVWMGLLGGAASGLLAEAAVVIAEHRRKQKLEDGYGMLRRVRLLEQGDTALSFYESPSSS